MYNFRLTFDRHEGRYGYKTGNFPPTYSIYEGSLSYANDPDFTQKFTIVRLPVKLFVFLFIFGVWWIRRRLEKVEEFDRLKRVE